MYHLKEWTATQEHPEFGIPFPIQFQAGFPTSKHIVKEFNMKLLGVSCLEES
jgi:hypothetical protein